MSRLTKEERAKLDNLPHTQFGEIERLVPRALRALDAAEAREKELEKILRAISKYKPQEVVKDDFAYDRLLAAIHKAARAALAKETDHG